MTPDITRNYHGDNPESLEASQSLDHMKALVRIQVETLLAVAGPRGLTCDEIEAKIGGSHQAVSPRLTELLAKGLVQRGERRLTRSGRYARALVHFNFWTGE